MIRNALPILAPLAFLMAACSPPDTDAPESAASDLTGEMPNFAPEAGPTASALPVPPVGGAAMDDDTPSTTGGDGSEIMLQPVGDTEVPPLAGELGCSFAGSDGETLLFAKANVGDDQSPSAVINNNGYGERIVSLQTGGFGMLEADGGKFEGRGITVTVTTGARSGGEGSETVVQKADLLAQRADGAERVYEGDWSCGP